MDKKKNLWNNKCEVVYRPHPRFVGPSPGCEWYPEIRISFQNFLSVKLLMNKTYGWYVDPRTVCGVSWVQNKGKHDPTRNPY